MTETTHRCPNCGAEVELVEGDERTKWMIPVSPGPDADATNMAVAINFALRYLPSPEDEPDQMRAAGIGALEGALSAHRRRVA
jgi:ssDNA-binding Zn-finger/Zn-ribbon topoisomerase 1